MWIASRRPHNCPVTDQADRPVPRRGPVDEPDEIRAAAAAPRTPAALHGCPQPSPGYMRGSSASGAADGAQLFSPSSRLRFDGRDLIAASRAAAAQYQGVASIEHVYPLVRTRAQLERVVAEIDNAPGIVLFTLVDPDLSRRLEAACEESGSPCLSVLGPVLTLFQSYLGQSSTPRAGAQHMLNPEYFKRIDALNFTMMSDDGQLTETLESADIVLLGVSRTSKTPTSIYLANRGYRTANIPLVPGVPPPRGARPSSPAADRRPGRVARSDRSDPPESPAGAAGQSGNRICRPRRRRARGQRFAPHVRRAQLADH